MGGVFSSPSPPPTPAPTPAPTREDPAVEEARKAEQLRAKKARGLASTILYGDEGESDDPLTVAGRLVNPGASKQLGG